jgi:hypothetical protein
LKQPAAAARPQTRFQAALSSRLAVDPGSTRQRTTTASTLERVLACPGLAPFMEREGLIWREREACEFRRGSGTLAEPGRLQHGDRRPADRQAGSGVWTGTPFRACGHLKRTVALLSQASSLACREVRED